MRLIWVGQDAMGASGSGGLLIRLAGAVPKLRFWVVPGAGIEPVLDGLAELRREIAIGSEQADRGGFVDGEETLAEIRRRSAQRKRAKG
jgi:hypothetical protein